MADEVNAPASVEEVATPVETAEVQPTTGSEAVTNTAEEPKQQFVPLDRFQDVNNNLKATRTELEEIKNKLGSIGTPVVEESGMDPEAEKLLSQWAEKRGLVTTDKLEEQQQRMRAEVQATEDLKSLENQYDPAKGYPKFDTDKVVEFAMTNMGAKTKAALDASYLYMHRAEIADMERKAALAEAGRPTASAESPGTGGGKQPEPDKPRGDLKSRISAAFEKHAT